MSYKGMDLNLRSSRAWPGREPGIDDNGANGGWSHPGRAAQEPIPVDDHVEACCNSAYDAAQFHGAAEVRLEHLLYAMTRIRAATELMEQLGIRAGHVRQETAVAIASVAPSHAELGTPRTSAEMEEILRRAAAIAGERKASATVADLLRALLGLGRKAPATQYLMRAATDPSALERWRDERRDSPQGLSADAAIRAATRPNLAEALFKRLDTMEAVLRALQTEIADDRKAITEALAQRLDPLPTAGIEQMQAVATELESRISETMGSLSERLTAIDKLPASENLGYMAARLELIEKQLNKQGKDVAESVSNALLEHLIKADNDSGETHGHTDRLGTLEASIESHLQRSDEASRTHEHSLAEIYEALVKLGTNQQTLANNLNTWRVESSGDISIISNRLQDMEANAQDTLNRLAGQVQSLRHVSRGEQRPFGSFKRWLYGTHSVLSGAWRDDPDAVRKKLSPASAPVQEAATTESESTVTMKVLPPSDALAEEKKA